MSIDPTRDRSESIRRPCVTWPVAGPGLSALVDLGLPVTEIARYFAVEPAAVRDRLDAIDPPAP